MLLLLAEDDTLIGFNLEDDFQDAGYEVAGPFTTCGAAIAWLKTHSPTVALVSYHLKDGPCTELVRELHGRGIPFAIYSGSHIQVPPREFHGAPWIEKPASFTTILNTITIVSTVNTINSADL